jgi:hypothetical protein
MCRGSSLAAAGLVAEALAVQEDSKREAEDDSVAAATGAAEALKDSAQAAMEAAAEVTDWVAATAEENQAAVLVKVTQ